MIDSITIATPCFNEETVLSTYFERIDFVRDQLKLEGCQVRLLLIDDGSSDRTLQIFGEYAQRNSNVTVIAHPQNLGYGAAVKTAMALARTNWLIFVDSDTNYDQRLILELIRTVETEPDLVNVSILAPQGQAGFAWYRRLLSSSASLLYRVLFPMLTRNVFTMTCGFRLYRTAILPDIFPMGDDFFATSEIMLRALRTGKRVTEFPAVNHRREQGVSKMKVFRNMMGHLRLALRTRFALLGDAGSLAEHLRRIGVYT